MRVHSVNKSSELQSRDLTSLEELESLRDKVDWLWIDLLKPDNQELSIIAELVGDQKVVRDIQTKKVLARPKIVGNLSLLYIPQATFKDKLETFPIYVFTRDRILVTVRDKYSSETVENTLRTFEDCVGKVCKGKANSSFILSRIFHELSNENLNIVMSLRQTIDDIEHDALSNPASKEINRLVFEMKRQISAFERVLWAQRELMLSISEGVVPTIDASDEVAVSFSHPINNISRELSLLDSHNNALDSILRLQDLGMIHRVERNLTYLTVIALMVSILLILLEIDILSLLYAGT